MARFRDDRTYWNQRYRESSHSSRLPDPFLLEAYERYVAPPCARPGEALDVAGGVGRHAVWLARRGWDVTLVDISEVGLERARTAAAKSLSGQGQVDFVAADLERWRPGRSLRSGAGLLLSPTIAVPRPEGRAQARRAAYL